MGYNSCTGLQRVRDSLKAQLRDLSKQKPRGQTDENLLSEISRLEAGLTVARDDLVGILTSRFTLRVWVVECWMCRLRVNNAFRGLRTK
jgi:hypothetical protein